MGLVKSNQILRNDRDRLTDSTQEVMVSGVLLKLTCIRKENAERITERQLRMVPPFLWAHDLCTM